MKAGETVVVLETALVYECIKYSCCTGRSFFAATNELKPYGFWPWFWAIVAILTWAWPAWMGGAVIAAHRFTGYEQEEDRARVVALLRDGEPVERIEAGQPASVVLDHTPFYAESGGQVGDTGALQGPASAFAVADTRKEGAVHVHVGTLERGALSVGDEVTAHVDTARRTRIRANHSATHLLHAALREVLGPHVAQKGSLVNAERLRFDFSHGKPVSADELARIETLVNAQIRGNAAAEVREMAIADAQAAGAMALFGEKYGHEVRVLTMGNGFSVELCGGTHVQRTGDIGLFKLLAESGVAAGVRP